MQSFNRSIVHNITKYLPTEAKFHLKLTNKRFSSLVDLSDDYERWKLKRATEAFCIKGHVSVKGDDIFMRSIFFDVNIEDEDVVKISIYSVKNVKWLNLKKNSITCIIDRNNWKLYDSLVIKHENYVTGHGLVTLKKRTVEIINGVLTEEKDTEILYEEDFWKKNIKFLKTFNNSFEQEMDHKNLLFNL